MKYEDMTPEQREAETKRLLLAKLRDDERQRWLQAIIGTVAGIVLLALVTGWWKV